MTGNGALLTGDESRSPHEAKRNAGRRLPLSTALLKDPDCAALHPGYVLRIEAAELFGQVD
jgi:hypothetical protein